MSLVRLPEDARQPAPFRGATLWKRNGGLYLGMTLKHRRDGHDNHQPPHPELHARQSHDWAAPGTSLLWITVNAELPG